MKSKEELLSQTYCILAELQHGAIKKNNPSFANILITRLELLYEILGEEIPEEYWKQIEDQLDYIAA